MDLIRAILLKLEEIERPHGFCRIGSYDTDFAFEGALPDDVDAHVNMLFDAVPKVHIEAIRIVPVGTPPSFDDVALHLEYENVGGGTSREVRLRVKQAGVFGNYPVIAEGDDGESFLKDDRRSYEFDHVTIAAANTELMACFNIDGIEPQS